jgi:hypothetical protein
MAYATVNEAATARSAVEKNLSKIKGYLVHTDKLDKKTKSGLESYLKKFEKEAEEIDFELANHIKSELSSEFFSERPPVYRLVRFVAEMGLIEPEHWPAVKIALEDMKFTKLEVEMTRLNLMAYEEDPVYLIGLWLEYRYGKRSVLDPVSRKRLDIIKERVKQGGTHALTPVLLATVPLLFEDSDMSFLKEILAKTELLSEEEKVRFKTLYALATQGKRVELMAVVSKIIDAHAELMTKAKFSVM